MTIHVANTVAEFLKEIKKGFNKVKWVELYNETQTEPYEGEQTQEEFEERMKDYAVFVAHADLYGEDLSSFDDDDDYRTTEISWTKFEQDFTAELRKRLGDDVKIEFRSGCNEWECIRVPGYSYTKTQEELKEQRVLKVGGHAVKTIVQACRDFESSTQSEALQSILEKDGVCIGEIQNTLRKLAFDVLVKYGNLI